MDAIVPTYSQKWYEMRKTHLGASEIAALCGLDPWKTPEQVWESKYAESFLQPDGGVNTRIWWGHQEEQHIIKAAIHELHQNTAQPWVREGLSWYTKGFMVSPDAVYTMRHQQPDNIRSVDNWLIEAKTVGENAKSVWRNGPPKHVLMQVHAQAALMRSQGAYVAARLAGAPVKVWKVELNKDLFTIIEEIVARFWQQKSIPSTWHFDIEEKLIECGFLARPEEIKPQQVDLEGVALLMDWHEVKKQLRSAVSREKELRRQIEEILGENNAIVSGNDVLVNAHIVTRTGIDVDALLADMPELAEKYKKIVQYRAFRETKILGA